MTRILTLAYGVFDRFRVQEVWRAFCELQSGMRAHAESRNQLPMLVPEWPRHSPVTPPSLPERIVL